MDLSKTIKFDDLTANFVTQTHKLLQAGKIC